MDPKAEKIRTKSDEIEALLTGWGLILDTAEWDVKKAQIKLWLSNFLASEIEDAFTILTKVQYKHPNFISTAIAKLAREIANIFDDNLSGVKFFPLGRSPSSSGGMYLYDYRKALSLSEENVPYIEFDKALANTRALVFFDDMIGSGNQAILFANENLERLGIESYYVAIFAFNDGLKRVKDEACFKDVICGDRLSDEERAFHPDSLVFNDFDLATRERLETLCLHYGNELYPDHPLGYDDSQALLAFPHNTPNNTLPIIWASTENEKVKGYPWNPIFERKKKDRSQSDSTGSGISKMIYDLETDDGIKQLIKACTDAHSRKNYILYNKLLNRFSLKLKMKGLHRELSQICELDVYRRDADNVYPTLTYSQCNLVTYNIKEAFNALNHWIENDPKLESLSPLGRLRFVITYSEILMSDGAYDLACNILDISLSYRSIEKTKFKDLCHALVALGRAHLGKGDIDSAFDLFEATLVEQNLTADTQGIAIAEMNIGIAHMVNENYGVAKRIFADAMEKFRGHDIRAFAWAQLNLAMAVSKAGGPEKIEVLVSLALDYYATHFECSRDYLANLEFFTKLDGFNSSIENRIQSEYARVSYEINENRLSNDQLLSAERTISVFALQLGYSGRASARQRTVTGGGFKARSTIVKSFKESLDTDSAEKYLETITQKDNHFARPFYNDFLVEVCTRRKDLIQSLVIQETDNILKQTDSIKIFYAKFLESEDLLEVAEEILDAVQNKETYEYLNVRANIYSHRGNKFFDETMDAYTRALDATAVDQYKAQVYNNLARLIHRHHKRSYYEKAIDYCKKSIELRATVRFWYPSVLMLALNIELANMGDIRDLVEEHRKKYGLKAHEAKEVSRMIYDKPKEKSFREYSKL